MGKVEDILLKYSPEQIQAALASMASGENNYKNGGKIHIKKSHRGRLTKLKKRTGKTEAELYNDGNPAHRKMVVFARNARKWNHADGGLMHKYDSKNEDTGVLQKPNRDGSLFDINEANKHLAENMGLNYIAASEFSPEQLTVSNPYTADDFFERWYSQRVNQMAAHEKNFSLFPFRGTRHFAGVAQEDIDRGIKALNDLREYTVPIGWPRSAGNEATGRFTNALNDNNARQVLTSIRAQEKGEAVPEGGYSDAELKKVMLDKEGFQTPGYIFYDTYNPGLGLLVHERSHAFNQLPARAIYELKRKFLRNNNLYSDTIDDRQRYNLNYLSSPDEIMARLNSIRATLNLNPKKQITREDLQEIRKRASDNDRKEFLDLYTDDFLLSLFNTIASADAKASLPYNANYAAYGGRLNTFQEGGILVNPWAPNYTIPLFLHMSGVQQSSQKANTEPTPHVSKYKELEDIADRQRYLESGYDNSAVSKAGAMGAFQIMPNTQKHWEEKNGWSGDINEYAYNKQLRDAELEWAYDTDVAKKGNPTPEVRLAKALAMYNRGYGNIVKDLEKAKSMGYDIYNSLDWIDVIPMQETRNYIRFMLGQDVGGRLTAKSYNKAKDAFEAKKKQQK